MEAQVNLFLESLTAQNRSPQTTAAYRTDLFQFTRFIRESSTSSHRVIESWDDVDSAAVHSYAHNLEMTLKFAPATIARKIAALRTFFGFLIAHGEALSNPVTGLDLSTPEKSPVRSLPAADLTRLLTSPMHAERLCALRDKALLELLCSAGVRQTELINLTVGDVDLAACRIVCGAGRTRRSLPLPAAAQDALARYLVEERPHLRNNSNEQSLFLNHLGKRLSRQGVWLIIQRHAEHAGIVTPVTPLMLRRTFAAQQFATGADISLVQKRLGLASAASARVYRKAARLTAPELEIDGVAAVRSKE